MSPVTEPRLSVNLGGLTLENPVMVASGTFGYGEEYASVIDLNRLGAVVVKGLSLKPRQGYPAPRLCETPSGMLNAIGLENVGVETFVHEKLPFLRQFKTRVVVNIFGETIEEYQEVARRLDGVEGVHALEVNISCPNVKKGGISFGSDPRATFDVLSAVRQTTRLPLIAKLSPNVTDITEFALAAKTASVDVISLVNTLVGMVIDIQTQRPVLSALTGGLSGPAIRPVAVRMVWEVVHAVDLPVIGMGGITCAEDAIEFFMAGATAVAIGTANFIDPTTSIKVLEGIQSYLLKNGYEDIHQIIGITKKQ
ncbi:MAG: dihydroorotate dehydrogenase [Nitrospira sp.]|nr:dihydroorotate dehydrogenase [Nitrospira sp.]